MNTAEVLVTDVILVLLEIVRFVVFLLRQMLAERVPVGKLESVALCQ